MTRQEIDTALDNHTLYIAMAKPGKWWQLRRNGATQTWKRDPSRFRIPVKFGLKGYEAITETFPTDQLRIAPDRETAEKGPAPSRAKVKLCGLRPTRRFPQRFAA